jgi:hypothetical protein
MRQMRLVLAALAVLALTLPAVAQAGSVDLRQHVGPAGSVEVTIVVRKPASFRVLLRTRTQGRTQLFLVGKSAPGGGALMDTATTACEGAAGSFYCSGSYEPLPQGRYTFRIVRASGPGANVELTVRW